MSTATLSAPTQLIAAAKPQPVLWSASSWDTYKKCPLKLKLREDKWSAPNTKQDSRGAVLAVPGLVVDKLFELWLHRREFENWDWLKSNFDMIWSLVSEKQRPGWTDSVEEDYIRKQTRRSTIILFDLLHEHQLLNDRMGIQTSFHESLPEVGEGVSIAGAIDLWTIRPDNTLVVVDFKNFSSESHRSFDQLHLYAIALNRMLGRDADEAGYVCFHPNAVGYRQAALRPCDRNRLIARLARATQAKRSGQMPAKFNDFMCPRFCEMRFSCPAFADRYGPRTPAIQ